MRFLTATLLLIVMGCTTNPYTGERQVSKTAKGAGVGALAGAVIGALTGDDADERRKRALAGAGIGALAGAGVGAYMDAQEAKLREQLKNSEVSVVRVGDDLVLSMPGNVTFEVDQSDLHADFRPVLDSVSLVLDEYEQTLVDVVGHTDSTGSESHNMRLSQRRASSVGDYLEQTGVERMRILTEGAGPHHPVADNRTSWGREMNRRVELVLKPITEHRSGV